jgi:hypothetical protein
LPERGRTTVSSVSISQHQRRPQCLAEFGDVSASRLVTDVRLPFPKIGCAISIADSASPIRSGILSAAGTSASPTQHLPRIVAAHLGQEASNKWSLV